MSSGKLEIGMFTNNRDGRFYRNYNGMEVKVRPDDRGMTVVYGELWRFSE